MAEELVTKHASNLKKSISKFENELSGSFEVFPSICKFFHRFAFSSCQNFDVVINILDQEL